MKTRKWIPAISILSLCVLGGMQMNGMIFAGPAESELGSNQVVIGKSEKRMKASIPSDNQMPKERKPNLIYRGFEAVAHGIYYVAKATVDAVGKGTDLLVRTVQKASNKVYHTCKKPFQKEEKSKKKNL